MNDKEYPWQNKSLVNMKGEVWKDIPGYEGYYQASSWGRIKSVDREVLHPRLKKQFVKGRILTQQVKKTPNLKVGKPSISLQVALSVESRMYYANVKRLIYATFFRNINYDKDGLYVINKNGDDYDNRPDNLQLVTKSVKGKRAFERGRADASYLKTADRSKWTKPYGGHTRRKPVEQCDMNGKLIAAFKSIREASRETGCGEKEIILVAKGIHHHTRGFKWRYVEEK